MGTPLDIIITMAGEGSRFRQAGYELPKFMIQAKDKSLFAWSLSSLENFFDRKFVFILRNEPEYAAFVEKECRKLKIQHYELVQLAQATSGQAETALMARGALCSEANPIAIYNIDTYVEPHALRPELIRGKGWIPVFEAQGDKWSFVTFDESRRVTAIAEKRRISCYATIGLYYFQSFESYERCYEECRFDGYRERFVAPLYECLFRDPSCTVYAELLDPSVVHGLGTPEDVRFFCENAGDSRKS